PNIEVRQLQAGYLSHQIVKTDTSMLVAIFLYSQVTSQYPLLECSRSSPLFRSIEKEFNELWNVNRTDSAGVSTPPKNPLELNEGQNPSQEPVRVAPAVRS